VTIIVGIATVVAINIFGQAAEQANQDAIRQDLMAAAAQAQGLWARPEMMGGTGGNFTEGPADQQFAERLGIPGSIAGLEVDNENAVYTIVRTGADELNISAVPKGSSGTWNVQILRQTGAGQSAWLVTINDADGQDQVLGDDGTS